MPKFTFMKDCRCDCCNKVTDTVRLLAGRRPPVWLCESCARKILATFPGGRVSEAEYTRLSGRSRKERDAFRDGVSFALDELRMSIIPELMDCKMLKEELTGRLHVLSKSIQMSLLCEGSTKERGDER